MIKKMYVLTLISLSLASMQMQAGARNNIIDALKNLILPYTAMHSRLSSIIAQTGVPLARHRMERIAQHKQGQAAALWLQRARRGK